MSGKSRKHTIFRALIAVFLPAVLIAALFCLPVFADMGPKPSVHVYADGLPDHTCYATLLGTTEAYGPYSVISDGRVGSTDGEADAYDAFRAYAKATEAVAADGSEVYYFWGQLFTLKGNGFSWGYYPPQSFKVLIYDPENGRVYASEKTGRYAFESYFRVTLLDDGTLSLKKEPHLAGNITSFLLRVVITLAVELFLALLFGYRKKREIRLIIIVNIITQVILNLILSYMDYYSGTLAWLFFFPVMELVVFVIEAAAYARGLRSHSKKRAVLYALIANAATAFIGLFIALNI